MADRLRLVMIQVLVIAGLLVLADALLWLLAPVSVVRQEVRVRQHLAGLQPQITYASFDGGFRSRTLQSLSKPDKSVRVLCLGASTTDQATQNVEDTYCGLLGRRLEAAHPTWRGSVETLSIGRGGWRAYDNLLWLAGRIDAVAPDVVVTLLGINDLAWAGGPGWKPRDVERALARAWGLAAGDHGAKRLCLAYSQICRRIVLAAMIMSAARERAGPGRIEWHSANLGRLQTAYRALPAVDVPVRDPDPFVEFEAAVRHLLGQLAKRGIDVIVLGQPVLWKEKLAPEEAERLWFSVATPGGPVRPSAWWLAAEMGRYNSLQRRLAEERGMVFVDLDAAIPKDLEHYFDDCHFTDKGSRAVADAAYPAVERSVGRRIQRRGLGGAAPAGNRKQE